MQARLLGALALMLFACGSETNPNPGVVTEGTAPPARGTGDAPPAAPPATPPAAESPPAAKLPSLELGAPIQIGNDEYEKWVWVPITGSECGDGSEAGIGINFTSQSRDLVIWFQGNGICYDGASCNLFPQMLGGMGPNPLSHLFWENMDSAYHGPFNREDAANPFKKSNFVVFPHCALDGHAGNKESDYKGLPKIHQHGYRNVTEALRRIVPTFTDATRIVVAGFSAGGIGTVANYHQIASVFESIGKPPPFMINDAGPVLRAPFLTEKAQKALREGWNLDSTFLSFCPACVTEGIHMVHEAMWKAHPGMRSVLVGGYQDVTVMNLYRLMNRDVNVANNDKLHQGLVDFEQWAATRQTAIAPSAHRSFFRATDVHGLIFPDFGQRPQLTAFINAQLDGSPNWASDVP